MKRLCIGVIAKQAFLNHVHLPPWVLSSLDFNERPARLRLAGVRDSNRPFFTQLELTSSAKRRGEIFHDYMCVKFALHQWESYSNTARSSLRNSYVRFLRGWGVDSNSIEGAVLKSWVESRFGIRCTYHREPLDLALDSEHNRFAYDRMKGCARTNAIDSQLDLLYEFCQYELARRNPDKKWLTLYRGTHDAEEYEVLEHCVARQRCVLLNNLSSFTSDREKAWEFGSTVWRAEVPICKIFFYSELLPDSLLKGEDEYLVIGGNYWVRELLY